MPIMGDLPIRDFEMTVLKAIRLLPSVGLVVIIRMESLSKKLRTLLLEGVLCSCMQNVCSLNIYPPFFGRLQSNAMRIV
jgi:hypothetical protein